MKIMEGAQGSPGGSPSNGPVPVMDGNELARRMILASESASQAASAAVRALEEFQKQQVAGSDEKGWYKLLPKPNTWEPKTREEELGQWRDWSWSLEQYLATLDQQFVADIENIRKNVETFVDMSVMHEDEKKRCSFLYGLLASLLRGRPLQVVKQVEKANGFESLRQLVVACEPASRNRSMGLLSCILSWPSFSSKSTYLAQILKFETAVNEFEKTGEKVSDSIKSAVLMRSVTGNLKTWLQLRLTDSTSYNELRESILAFERSTTKWVDAMMPGGEMASGSGDAIPMEVDRVKGDGKFDKGKMKGKGKGKKGDWKGLKGHSKGKGYGSFAKGNHSEAKGKGKSDKGKSKGKSKTDETCYHCGKKGHFARDCWSRVRQVQGQNAMVDTSASQTQSAPNVNATNGAATGSTPNNVRRVQNSMSINTPTTLFFDLQEDSDQEKDCRRVVRVVRSSSRCENYFIGIDDGEFETCDHVKEISLVEDKMLRSSTSSMIFDSGFMENYEIEKSFNKNKMRLGSEAFVPGRRRECRALQRGQVQGEDGSVFEEEVTIILDSGSDATVLPLAYSNVGVDAGRGAQLWDAQGGQMPTYGCRELCVEFLGEGGEHVIIKDKGHLSAGVSQPLISYGRLLRRGWTIAIGEDNKPKLVHLKKGASIPIDFKNDSLTVKGWIRRVSYVRHVPADVPQVWTRSSSSWTTTGRGFPIKSSPGGKLVDPTGDFSVDEWPYRTTLALDDKGWNMIEFCEDLRQLENKSEEIETKWNRLLTVLTLEAIPPEQIGFLVSDSFQDAGAAGSSGSQAAEAANVQREDAGVGGDTPMEERREVEVQASMVPELPLRQELAVQDDAVVLEGIRVLPTSSAATLRAACTYLGISQGGAKVKMWNRIQAYMDKQRLEAAQQIAVQVREEGAREPKEQKKNVPPDDPREITRHNLTHLPYQPWCSACVKGKGRPDAHPRDDQNRTRSEHSTVSFDFCFTGKRADGEVLGPVPQGDKAKLTCLVMTDSKTRAVQAVPVFNKGDIKFMSKEVCRFVQFLGYSTVALRCDQEPTMLRVQDLAQQAMKRLGITVHINNPKIKDHAGNGYVEGAIHRIRQTASVLLCSAEEHLGMKISPEHPLMSWSFVHASFLLNRFVTYGNQTPFELVTGREYSGKVCEFGEPILAYTYAAPMPKGGARWEDAIFLSKAATNDMFVVGVGNSIKLTRSIKRIHESWHDKSNLHQEFCVPSWMVEIRGNRLTPGVTRKPPGANPTNEIDDTEDEAASDPPSGTELGGEVSLILPDSVPLHALVSSGGPLTPVPIVRTPRATAAPPSVVPAAASAAASMEISEQGVQEVRAPAEGEPALKRARLNVNRIAGEELHHVDEEVSFEYRWFEDENIEDYTVDFNDEDEKNFEEYKVDMEQLWYPYTDEEPLLDEETMTYLNDLADKVEINRLLEMEVLVKPKDYTGDLGTTLTAKFVRTWRKKVKNGETMWLRRSRLVAREFSFWEIRQDTYAPASSSSSLKLLPSLVMNGFYPDGTVLGSMDIGDAYLNVKQECPRPIKMIDSNNDQQFIIARCLPGQRDGARRWYDHCSKVLIDEFQAVACLEQPSIFRLQGHGALLLHVDDVLFALDEEFVKVELQEKLNKHYKFTLDYAPRRTGGSFEFLKKVFEIDPDYEKMTIHPETKHIRHAHEQYTKLNGKPPRLYNTPSNAQTFAEDHTELLDAKKSEAFRSMVGALLYVSLDRGDVQYSVKQLASYLQNPTKHSWIMLGRLIGYLKQSEMYASTMYKSKLGASLFSRIANGSPDYEHVLIESFSDADWSCKCTSSGCHYISGNLVFSTSRSQKAISLSSTESEWYAAISTAIDSLHIMHIVVFLGGTVSLVMRVDNTAVVSISTKLGTARLKHIQGKLLWLQGKVSEGILKLKAVGTNFNVADIGTKALGRVKHLTMCYMLGLTDGGKAVGEHEYDRLCTEEVVRREERQLVRQVCSGSRSTSAARNLVLILAGMAQIGEGAPMEGSKLEALSWLSIYALVVTFVAVILGGLLLMKRGYDSGYEGGDDEPPTTRRRRSTPEEEVETEAYETSEVSGGDPLRAEGDGDDLRGEEPEGDQLHDGECLDSPLHAEGAHGDQLSGGELREVQLQEEGGESEFEAGIFGAESDEASADSLSLRLVEGAASDLVLEAIALSELEDKTKKHVGEDVRKKNYRRISLMARTLITGYKKGDFKEFGHEYILRALRHLRLWQRINSNLAYFVEDLLNRLSDGTETTRDMVLNLDSQLGPVTVLNFDSEAAYWGVLSDDELAPESSDSRTRRYKSSSLSEISDVDYWLRTRYEDEGPTRQNENENEDEYEPSIAPGSPAIHGEDEVQSGDGGALLPVEEEIEAGVGEHPSAAEVAADEEAEDLDNRMMRLYREMLDAAEEAEVHGEHEHAGWLRQQAEELHW